MEYHREVLKAELMRRQARDSGYSLRDFARQLAVSPALLSLIIRGKRSVGLKTAQKISSQLGLSVDQSNQFISSSVLGKSTGTLDRSIPTAVVSETRLRLIESWENFAILALAKFKQAKAEPLWVSRKLGISARRARNCLNTLIEQNIISVKNGSYKQVAPMIRSANDVPSEAVKAHQSGLLEKAREALRLPVQSRQFGTRVLSIEEKSIPEFKEKLRKLLDEFDMEVEQNTHSRDAVYALCLQFFPLSNLNSGGSVHEND